MLIVFFVIITFPDLSSTYAQTSAQSSKVENFFFKGKVLDKKGEIIPFATIYISEIKSGIAADRNGEFSSPLTSGLYHCTVSSLGFIPANFTVEIAGKNVEKTIVLEESAFLLDEVVVSPDKEDRAYSIIRKAMERAPFYEARAKKYKCQNYLKGSFSIDRMPKIFTMGASENEKGIILNRVFVLESVSDIEYTYPNIYDRKIKAFSNTMPFKMEPVNFGGSSDGSVYNPIFFGVLSPLSQEAFSYYTFKYEGFYNENNRIIYKILIVPKRISPTLMTGRIFIEDVSWSVDNIESVILRQEGKYNIKQRYQEFNQGIYLPIASSVEADISLFGIRVTGNYYSSFKYSDIEANPEGTLPERKSVAQVKVQKDSLALSKDSLYWHNIRNVPLSAKEQKSYREADSLKIEVEKIRIKDSLDSKKFVNAVLLPIVMGHKYHVSPNTKLGFSGLAGAWSRYNFTDGYWIGQELSLVTSFGERGSLSFVPSAFYASARKIMLWETFIKYNYPQNRGFSEISFGRTTKGINDRTALSNQLNSWLSYFTGSSKISYYDSRYIALSTLFKPSKEFLISLSLSRDKISPLDNSVHKSLFGRETSPNQKENYYGDSLKNHIRNGAELTIDYAPEIPYFPRISLDIDAAYSTSLTDSRYIKTEISASKEYKLNIFSRISCFVNTGFFPYTKTLHLTDYKYIPTNFLILAGHDMDRAFSLLDNSYYPSKKSWIQGHINYYSDFLLIKRLSFVDLPFWEEGLHVKYLLLPDISQTYSEVGYSIGQRFLMNAAIFIGFKNWKYDAFGIRFSIPIFSKSLFTAGK